MYYKSAKYGYVLMYGCRTGYGTWNLSKRQIVSWIHTFGDTASRIRSMQDLVSKVPGIRSGKLYDLDEGMSMCEKII